jgi:ethanolamine ammonia-lyase small subunit
MPDLPIPSRPDSLLPAIRERTPARIFQGRAGLAYPTRTQLDLRADHAAAVDAVRAEIDLSRDFDADFIARHGLYEVQTRAADKEEYLRRPDLGRRLNDVALENIARLSPREADLQIVLGDGLSVAAVMQQVPSLLPLIESLATREGWTLGRPFLLRHCRVGVLNDIGDLLSPRVVVLLIGERPGLATAESLSAYMAWKPRTGQTDADRNLISNIHNRGVSCEAAAARIVAMAGEMMRRELSGVELKEACVSQQSLIRAPGLGTRSHTPTSS